MSFLKNKKLLAIIFIFIAAFVVYAVMTPSENFEALPIMEVSGTSGIGQDLVVLLSELNSINLDVSVLANPLLRELKDFGVEIVPQPISRKNPFAPFEVSATSIDDEDLDLD